MQIDQNKMKQKKKSCRSDNALVINPIINAACACNNQKSAPMSPGSQISLEFYTHRIRTSTMFVKKCVKRHSVASQLSVN